MTLDYEVYKEGGILNDRYQKIEDISDGSYGFVSLAKDTHKKQLVAVKHIFKMEEKEGERNDKEGKEDDDGSLCYEAMWEIDIQTKLGNEHRNIVKLLDHFDSYIVLEYCPGGDLYEAIKGGLVPRKTKKITNILEQMIDAIEFCHSKGVYHRDIKPENILITNLFEWTIKLSDWGLATTDKTSLDRNVGSERYMAPELFESNLDIDERKEPYSCAQVDVWSLGVVFLNTVFLKNPFSVANQSDKAFCYFAANREALFDVFSTMSLDFFQVLRYCLTIDPANRDLNKMRRELRNLSEYTLDDEYYNSLDDDLAVEEEPPSLAVPPSSAPAPAPVSLLTPASSNEYKKHIEKRRASDVKEVTLTGERNKNNQGQEARAKSVPKFKFQKRSHPSMGKTTEAKPIKYNQKNHFNFGRSHHNNFHHQNRLQPIKNSRKPLGIPTPNTHINNFFDDYRKARNNNNHHGNNHGRNGNSYHSGSEWHSNGFNTRDFFTPPSVHNRYMEGIFSSGRKHGNHNNNNGNNNNHNRQRRSSFSQSNNNNVRSFLHATSPVAHSPGKYIPPNARNQYNWSMDSPPPNTNTYHEQFTKSGSDSSGEGNAVNDMDDVLFTLEENDNDFVNDLDSLSLHDSNHGKTPTPSETQRPVSPVMPTVQVTSENEDLPDLLKSPATNSHERLYPKSNGLSNFLRSSAANVADGHEHSNNNGNGDARNHGDNSDNGNPKVQQTRAPRKSSVSDNKYKSGVYVPPHHRKNSASMPSPSSTANEATLSVTKNSLNYSTSFQPRRQSGNNGYRSKPLIPPMNNNHSDFTTAVQDGDIFAQTSSDALLFEDDDTSAPTSPRSGGNHPGERSMFGPYEIYDNGAFPLGKLRTGRKSSTFQEEAVGSLEQYKNNWLILQRQQD